MIVDIESDPRHGLQVQRYHTWPTIRKQSVGEHSAQVSRIMLSIDPGCCRDLLVHAIEHDVGEMVGDLPWPVKRNDSVIKGRMDMAEENLCSAMHEQWNFPSLILSRHHLSSLELEFFKMCESIEMWEYALQEQNMGNRYATVVATRMLLAASELMGRMVPKIKSAARLYVARRQAQESETELVPVGAVFDDPSGEEMIHVEKREKRA